MDSDSSSSSIYIIILIISLTVFFIAYVAEHSVFAMRRERVQRLLAQNESGAEALDKLFSLSSGPSSALTFVKFVFFIVSVIAAVSITVFEFGYHWIAITSVGIIVALVQLVMFSAVQSLTAVYGDRIALMVATPVKILTWTLSPLLKCVDFIVNKFFPSYENVDSDSEVQVVELGMSIEDDGEPLDQREVEMIRGVVELDDTIAREIMVPRGDMIVADVATPLDDLAEMMIDNGHSRIPVFRAALDQIVGVAHVRDILKQVATGSERSNGLIEGMLRPALFIPESKTLEELLAEFQQQRTHMAIVVDEHGGVSGLVTIEDLLEEIVGDILDEFDVGKQEIVPLNSETFLMDAGVSLDDLNDLLGIDVEGDGFDSIGGLVLQRLGKIAGPGEIVLLDGLSIEVLSTSGRRLKRLKVSKLSSSYESDLNERES